MHPAPSTDFAHFLANALNERQRAAVEPTAGVILVRAGAGSGKTRVITARITNLLLNHDVPASAIVALTFTNKAAREMRERITHFLPTGQTMPFVGTFHAYALYLLKRQGERSPYAQWSLLDEDDREKMLKAIIERTPTQRKITPKALGSVISSLKNESASGTPAYGSITDPLIRSMAQLYERDKNAARCLDFDDLLLNLLHQLKTDSTFRSYMQATLRHLLVDEYQDTNKVQHALLKTLATDDKGTFTITSLCAVGDEDQAIYSWRGATIANILSFADEFPGALSLTIDQNYRSAHSILEVANAVIAHNKERHDKRLWSAYNADNRVRVLTCASGAQEADTVRTFAVKARAQGCTSAAVLYRSHHQSRTLEEAFIKAGVAYTVVGGVRFYERQEIKDLLAYLRLCANGHDRIAFFRALNTPTRGLGQSTQELLAELWTTQPHWDYSSLITNALQTISLRPAAKASLERFMQLMASIGPEHTPLRALEQVITQTHFYDHLRKQFDEEEADERIANVRELCTATLALAERGITSVRDFLDEVALLQESAAKTTDEHPITLMTLHAAKGLEFDAVALTGLEEGVLPSGHALYAEELVEEERRLVYVGITRAREYALITHARYRVIYGSASDQRTSRFIREIIDGGALQLEIGSWPTMHISSWLTQWLQDSAPAVASEPKLSPATAVHLTPEKAEAKNGHAQWRIGQQVKHASFGLGIISGVEERASATTLLIKFGGTHRKIAASFIQEV